MSVFCDITDFKDFNMFIKEKYFLFMENFCLVAFIWS